MTFRILHISDLHRSPDDPISNAELISALVGDRDRGMRENPSIAPPQAAVISGDIVQGVPLGTENYQDRLAEQYAVAAEFLDELVERFLDGDRSRVVIVPGNHDIDWNTAFHAMVPVPAADIPANVKSLLDGAESEYRWDWKTLTLYRIADPGLYERRLDAFWRFYEEFYHGVAGLLKVPSRADANLFALADDRVGVAAYNSCYGNDCFAFHGMIRKEVVARSHLELNDSGGVFDLRMAVWHHSIEGPPSRTDYMDVDIVRGMIGRGFRLGLYGHQHKTQVNPQQVWLPDRERMAVVSAGSLCAGPNGLPVGVYRQYSIVEVGNDWRSVRVHVRSMSVANLFSRGHLVDFGGASFADLDWDPPRNLAGGTIDVESARLTSAIETAEATAKTGDPARAVGILRKVPLPAGSYQRQLLLSAARHAQDWATIVENSDPPTTMEELVLLVEALNHLRRTPSALSALDRYAGVLQLPASVTADLRNRILSQGAMQR